MNVYLIIIFINIIQSKSYISFCKFSEELNIILNKYLILMLINNNELLIIYINKENKNFRFF